MVEVEKVRAKLLEEANGALDLAKQLRGMGAERLSTQGLANIASLVDAAANAFESATWMTPEKPEET